MHTEIHGVINHTAAASRRTDYLYRVSLKCLVRNSRGEVLVVKESGRGFWDLPGGGMDHGETLEAAIAREMKEEVNMVCDFTYRVIAVDEPALLDVHSFWQLRLVFDVTPVSFDFTPGDDADDVAFINPEQFEHSELPVERRIYKFWLLSG